MNHELVVGAVGRVRSPTAADRTHRCLGCGGKIRADQETVRLWGDVMHEQCGLYQPRTRLARGDRR